MNFRSLFLTFGILACVVQTASAGLIDIDFEEFSDYELFQNGQVTTKGFLFQSETSLVVHSHVTKDLGWSSCCRASSRTTTLQSIDGNNFSLLQFDVHYLNDLVFVTDGSIEPIDALLNVAALNSLGELVELTIGPSTSTRTFTSKLFENLSRVDFTLVGTSESGHYPVVHLDNFVVSTTPESSTVEHTIPEPGTGYLLVGSMCLLLWGRRRKAPIT